MQAEFQRCMREMDAAGARRLWAHVAPHLQQPTCDAEAIIMLHMGRTRSESMSLKDRAYSHAWLSEHGYPSGLPDHLKQSADRMYPRVVEGVGIAVKASKPEFRPVADLVRGAMSDAVLDAYAERRTDPVFVKGRMFEARSKTLKQLLGSFYVTR